MIDRLAFQRLRLAQECESDLNLTAKPDPRWARSRYVRIADYTLRIAKACDDSLDLSNRESESEKLPEGAEAVKPAGPVIFIAHCCISLYG